GRPPEGRYERNPYWLGCPQNPQNPRKPRADQPLPPNIEDFEDFEDTPPGDEPPGTPPPAPDTAPGGSTAGCDPTGDPASSAGAGRDRRPQRAVRPPVPGPPGVRAGGGPRHHAAVAVAPRRRPLGQAHPGRLRRAGAGPGPRQDRADLRLVRWPHPRATPLRRP